MNFEIGISCSGGVSAGAYIAGVLDFLVQALDEWEAAKAADTPGVPRHAVTLKVMAGASAGAISSVIALVSLARNDSARLWPAPTPGKQTVKTWLPLLYDSWVVWPRLVAPEQVEPEIAAMANPPVPEALRKLDFLTITDLQGAGAKVLAPSVLNCQLLTYIGARAVQPVPHPTRERSYIAQTFDLYLTTSNNRGVPYEVGLTGGAYAMVSHGDRAHYRMTGLGTAAAQSIFGEADPAIAMALSGLQAPPQAAQDVPVESLVTAASSPNPAVRAWAPWYGLANSTLASAAFPVGLAARPQFATRADYVGRLLPQMGLGAGRIRPDFPPPEGNANFFASDGGLINNDPIEFVIAAMPSATNAASPTRSEETNQAVIMIAPFPEPSPYPAEDALKPDFLSIAKAMFNTLRQQVRFKPDLLLDAENGRIENRFLIGPKRVTSDNVEQPFALASGALGGFGGFIHRRYRDHDFQLGRRNCQRFLASVFQLSQENPLFEGRDGDAGKLPIIPLCGSAIPEVELPAWGTITQQEFSVLTKRITDRLAALRANFVQNTVSGWFRQQAVSGIIRLVQGQFMDKFFNSIRTDLEKRKQLQ